ncbi:hypothetical protein SISNIDRAFT_488253 [Sistotremastrum niveocremeum HHB9708]|uniref:Uncharacterized protein n=1 Tax=Sistotremastrum niveocremeum HHB9708 TaxID=1314777 RepID=A0A164RM11_9AGAM|nr:hypothetical protein SISNIDRAFT_488253 [Sistotremastrum niveocremeum HHB9708]
MKIQPGPTRKSRGRVSGDPKNSEDSGVDSEEDEFEIISNPSNDVRAALTAAFELLVAARSRGTFACSTTVDEFPMPGLHICGYGSVALPLTERIAQEIINFCSKSVSSQTKGRHVSEISANNISLQNSRWSTWLREKVLPEITSSLGVFCEAKCELDRLILYEAGSHVIPHQRSQGETSAFGSVLVTLPSSFKGGQVHMSHSGQIKTFDLAQTSSFGVSALGYYTAIHQSSKPITSGYQLVLAYNLVTPPGVKPPSLIDSSEVVKAVRHALLSWSQGYGPTKKLAYALQEHYDPFGTRGENLSDQDAQVVDIIRSLAAECRIEAYLANAELYVAGEAERRHGEYQMGAITSSEMTITDVTDLSGQELDIDGLEFEHPKEFIPKPLDDYPPDEEEPPPLEPIDSESSESSDSSHSPIDDDDSDVCHGEIFYTYRRSVLLLWPTRLHETILNDVNWLKDAASKLALSSQRTHTHSDKKLVEGVVRRLEHNGSPSQICRDICGEALRSRNLDLWLLGSGAGRFEGGSSILSHQELLEAISAFGFKSVQPVLEYVLKHSPTNQRRLALIASITSSPFYETHEVEKWCQDQRELAFKTLKTATLSDVEVLVALAASRGIAFVQQSIIPQLLQLQCSHAFWIVFLNKLFEERSRIGPSAHEVHTVIIQALSLYLQMIDPMVLKNSGDPHAPATYDPLPVMELIELCVELEMAETCSILFDKILQAPIPSDDDMRSDRTALFYQPILSNLTDLAGSHDVNWSHETFAPSVEMLLSEVIRDYLQNEDPCWEAAIKTARIGGVKGFGLLEAWLISHVKSLHGGHWEFIRDLGQHWDMHSDNEEGVAVKTLISKVITSLIDYQTLDIQRSKSLLVLCLETEDIALSERVLTRLKTSANDSHAYYSDVVIPFIAILGHELSTRKIKISSKPYGPWIGEVMLEFADKIMGPLPAASAAIRREELEDLDCGCESCQCMIDGLASDDSVVLLRGTAKERAHLETQINLSRLDLQFDTIKDGKPHTLQIIKPPSLTAGGIWNDRRDRAVESIQAIKPAKIWQQILADDFQRILKFLGLTLSSPAPRSSRRPIPTNTASKEAPHTRSKTTSNR